LANYPTSHANWQYRLARFTKLSDCDKNEGMGKAGKALRQVLETYGISQNQLAIEMRIPPSNVSRWVSESRDPSGEAIAAIKDALEQMKPEAAEEFVVLYLYSSRKSQENS
jgi:transcriptional regulator with XRE-family HTH domain